MSKRRLAITLDDVTRRVDEIARTFGDDEKQHNMEDALHRDVLNFIASGRVAPSTAASLARAALRTEEISFSRWSA